MPTIDELANVVVASDEDMLPVSQNGIARRVSRAQLLDGTQMALAMAPGLLGRVSPGLGAPQQIAIGTGLVLSGNVLSSAPRYSINNLPLSTNIGLSDLVPILQNGNDSAVSVKVLQSIAGLDISDQAAKAQSGSIRRLGDWFSDAVAVEAFGAEGDGITDDTDALNLAIASGRPVLLGPTTYRVDGQWNIQSSTTLIGTVGVTTLRRRLQKGGAWINITAPTFTSVGIIFDAGGIGGDSWGVIVCQSCIKTIIQNSDFINSTGTTLGTGLTIQARDGLSGSRSSHSITNSRFANNTCHGLWIQAACGAIVQNCQAHSNQGFGICLDFNDQSFQQAVRQSSVLASRCWNNTRGISIGNYNATNREPPTWGLDNPDAMDITVSGNVCFGNSAYGIAVSGARIQVVGNQIIIDDGSNSASGILCNASLTTIDGNSIVGPGGFGIDAGGSADTSIMSNTISNCAVGINAGGSQRIRASANKLVTNKRAITIFQVETDGQGTNFGIPCSDVWIEENLIVVDLNCGGILLLDGPERVEVVRNRFVVSTPGNVNDLCWAHTDSVSIRLNSLSGSIVTEAAAKTEGTAVQITIPDIIDEAIITASTTRVDSVFGLHQLAVAGQISFIRVQNGGLGYTRASVVIVGIGTGALGTAYLKNGVVIGIALTSGGSGYDPAATYATIIGDGSGALLTSFVGLPVAQNRLLKLWCRGAVVFPYGTSAGTIGNWTKNDIVVPAGSEVVLKSVDGSWQASAFVDVDHLQPDADGNLVIQTARGDIALRAGSGGGVRFQSSAEQSGCLTYLGRGSPEGLLTAPPGSDYRNLDGGVGATLWMKRVGSGNSGWYPVA